MKKNIFRFLAAMFILALFASCTNNNDDQGDSNKTSSKELTKVVVSEFRSITWMPIYVAYAKGFFKEEGLDIEFMYYKDGPIAFQGMHTDDSQFCLLSQEPVLAAQVQGLKSTLIGSVFKTRLYGLVANENITDMSQLKGTAIFAGMPGSAPYSFISSVLLQNGLDPEKDVTFVNMDYGASMAALKLGEISASYFKSDNLSDLKHIKHNILVYTENEKDNLAYLKAKEFPAEIVVATQKFTKEHPEIVQKFVNGMLKGVQWTNQHSSMQVAELTNSLYDAMTLEQLAEKIELAKKSFTEDCFISQEGQKAVEDFCLATNVISKKIPYNEIVDMSFLENALNKKQL